MAGLKTLHFSTRFMSQCWMEGGTRRDVKSTMDHKSEGGGREGGGREGQGGEPGEGEEMKGEKYREGEGERRGRKRERRGDEGLRGEGPAGEGGGVEGSGRIFGPTSSTTTRSGFGVFPGFEIPQNTEKLFFPPIGVHRHSGSKSEDILICPSHVARRYFFDWRKKTLPLS
jgi:hypothetical protein